MASPGCYAFFPTAIGACAIAWNDAGLSAVWLPEASREALRRRVQRRTPAAIETQPSGAIAGIVDAIVRLLAGEQEEDVFPPPEPEAEPTAEPERRPQVKPRPFPLPGGAAMQPPEPEAS